jgi:putative DNA primase/helicase
MAAVIESDMTAKEVAKRLGGRSRRSGDSILVSCPVPTHGKRRGDLDPSLSLTDGDNGRLVYNCLGNCSSTDVWAALIDKGVLAPKLDFAHFVRL